MIHVEVDDVYAHYDRAVAEGAEITKPLEDTFTAHASTKRPTSRATSGTSKGRWPRESRRGWRPQVVGDPVYLHDERGVAEPLALDAVAVVGVFLIERETRPTEGSLGAAFATLVDLAERVGDIGGVAETEQLVRERADQAGEGRE